MNKKFEIIIKKNRYFNLCKIYLFNKNNFKLNI